MGKDYTIFALDEGIVKFNKTKYHKTVSLCALLFLLLLFEVPVELQSSATGSPVSF